MSSAELDWFRCHPAYNSSGRMILNIIMEGVVDDLENTYFAVRMKYDDGNESTMYSAPSAVFKLSFFD